MDLGTVDSFHFLFPTQCSTRLNLNFEAAVLPEVALGSLLGKPARQAGGLGGALPELLGPDLCSVS